MPWFGLLESTNLLLKILYPKDMKIACYQCPKKKTFWPEAKEYEEERWTLENCFLSRREIRSDCRKVVNIWKKKLNGQGWNFKANLMEKGIHGQGWNVKVNLMEKGIHWKTPYTPARGAHDA